MVSNDRMYDYTILGHFSWQAEQSRRNQWSSSWTHIVWQKSDSKLSTCWPLADAKIQGGHFRVHVENRLTDHTMERTTGIVSSSAINSMSVCLCWLAALARYLSKGCETPTCYKLQRWCIDGNAMPYCSWAWLRVWLRRPETGMQRIFDLRSSLLTCYFSGWNFLVPCPCLDPVLWWPPRTPHYLWSSWSPQAPVRRWWW